MLRICNETKSHQPRNLPLSRSAVTSFPLTGKRSRFMWRKYRKTLMSFAGALYILFGILAFFGIPGGHEDHHHTFAHNITHIVLGALLLIFTWSLHAASRQVLCFVFAFGYFLIALIGALAGKHSTLPVIPGFIEFHAGDYGVHFATGIVFLTLGLLRCSDVSRVPA